MKTKPRILALIAVGLVAIGILAFTVRPSKQASSVKPSVESAVPHTVYYPDSELRAIKEYKRSFQYE